MLAHSFWVTVPLSLKPTVTLQIGKARGFDWHVCQKENETLPTSSRVPFSTLSGHDAYITVLSIKKQIVWSPTGVVQWLSVDL